MSSYTGVLVSDQWLQSQFTQVELRSLKSKVSILNIGFWFEFLNWIGSHKFRTTYIVSVYKFFSFWSFCGFQFILIKNQNGKVTVGDLPPIFVKLKTFREVYKEEEIKKILSDLGSDFSNEINFEGFLRVSHICFLSLSLIFSNNHAREHTHTFCWFMRFLWHTKMYEN